MRHRVRVFEGNRRLAIREGAAPILPVLAGVTTERTLIIADTAKLLGISRRTVYYRIREGRLRTVRTRGGSQRVLVSSIEALLRDTRTREDARVRRLLGGRKRDAASESKPLPL